MMSATDVMSRAKLKMSISLPAQVSLLHDNFQLKLVFDKKNQAIIDYTVGV
jgi:hypothetical protein